jgi:quercetin dioxygenase-like cupin family protein
MRSALALVWACAWGCAPQPAPAQPGNGNGNGNGNGSGTGTGTGSATATQDEILAAIQKGMNDLAPVAQQCWAKAATERFDLEGELEATVTVGQPVQVEVAVQGVPTIAPCMKTVLEHYTWAPPLRDQTFRLPFSFKAPDGQSVIDRTLVDAHGQGAVSVAVLLDENNTGNPRASMFEISIRAGGTTGLRVTDRDELWLLLDDAQVSSVALAETAVHRLDMMYAGAGTAREVTAARGDVHAVIVAVPGGREGAARAGALPTRELTGSRSAPRKPIVIAKADAQAWTGHDMYVESHVIPNAPLSASIASIPAGATIATHAHAHETELLYLLVGAGTLTIAGTQVAITPTSAIQIPPNTPHSFVATDAVRALQVYTPAGPEQRFKAPPKP